MVLATANLLVFGIQYQRQRGSEPPPGVWRAPPGVERLQLLSEVVEPAATASAEEHAGSGAEGVDVPASEPVGPAGVGPAPLGALVWAEPAEEPMVVASTEPAQEPTLAASTESVGPSTPPVLPQPEAASAASSSPMGASEASLPGPEPISSSERSPKEAPPEPTSEPEQEPQSATQAAPVGEQPATETTSSTRCFTLGPFRTLREVESLAEQISADGLEPRLRQEIRERQVGYWVLIPSPGSGRESRQMVRELKQAGIEDVWRFTKGKLRNSISLGLYSRQGPAQKHSRGINRKGFGSRVQPRSVEETHYWLDLNTARKPALDAATTADLARDYPEAALTERACNLVEVDDGD